MKIIFVQINIDVFMKKTFSCSSLSFFENKYKSNFEFVDINDEKEILVLKKNYMDEKIDLINVLENLNNYAQKNKIYFSLITFGNCFLLSLKKIENLLNMFIDSKCLIGSRMSQADAKNLFFDSLRSPFLDYHIVLMNNYLLNKKNFFSNAKPVFNHSFKVGAMNFKFINFLERNLKKKEFFNFYSKDILDEYGNDFKSHYVPYCLCTKYDILVCYPKFNKMFQKLFEINIGLKQNLFLIKYFFYKKDNYYFRRKFLRINSIINFFRKLSNFKNVVDEKSRNKTFNKLKDDRYRK